MQGDLRASTVTWYTLPEYYLRKYSHDSDEGIGVRFISCPLPCLYLNASCLVSKKQIMLGIIGFKAPQSIIFEHRKCSLAQ